MSSSSPISVPTSFAFLYSLPDLDSVVCSVLSALTSKLYFFHVFCTSAISANSNPIKSTSSAYTISVGRVFSKSEVGRGKMVLTSFRAFSKYMENKRGLRLSPCGDPMLLSNGFSFVAPFILVFMMKLKSRNMLLNHLSVFKYIKLERKQKKKENKKNRMRLKLCITQHL